MQKPGLEQSTYTGATSVHARFAKRTQIPETQLINPIDLEEDRAIGVLLPFGSEAITDTGYSRTHTSTEGIPAGTKPGTEGNTLFKLSYLTKDQLISNIRNLILTNKGERIMNPEFGTDIYHLLFENNMPELDEQIRESIEGAFKRYIPLAKIEDLQITQDEHLIHIMLGFSVKEYNIFEIIEITSGVS